MKSIIILIMIVFNSYALSAWATIKNDFSLPLNQWSTITANDLHGKHEIFTIKDGKEHIFFYRVSPGGEIGIKEHDNWEEVAIISGTLDWLDTDGQAKVILGTGAYVDRPPHVKHGPFKAGKNGCLMYVKMHG